LWLLIVFLLSMTGSGLFTRLQPAVTCGTGNKHSCCCIASGLTQCRCADSHHPAAQLASLSSCTGANDLPTSLPSLPPALLPPAVSALSLALIGPAAVGEGAPATSRSSNSASPPPQAV